MAREIELFNGFNNVSGTYGLWETNGTPSGTFELTPSNQAAVRAARIRLTSAFREAAHARGGELPHSSSTSSS